jgi:hypothetical protein
MGRHSKEVAAVVELQTAVMVDGQPVTRLELRRPVFGDLEAMSESKSEIGQLLILVSKLADIRPAEARRIDARDVAELGGVVAELMGTGDDEIPLDPGV